MNQIFTLNAIKHASSKPKSVFCKNALHWNCLCSQNSNALDKSQELMHFTTSFFSNTVLSQYVTRYIKPQTPNAMYPVDLQKSFLISGGIHLRKRVKNAINAKK